MTEHEFFVALEAMGEKYLHMSEGRYSCITCGKAFSRNDFQTAKRHNASRTHSQAVERVQKVREILNGWGLLEEFMETCHGGTYANFGCDACRQLYRRLIERWKIEQSTQTAEGASGSTRSL